VRAETRGETGLLLLSRHHCTAEPVQGDFFVERGLLGRIAHCIVSGTHSWKPPAAGGRHIHLGGNIETAGRLKAAQERNSKREHTQEKQADCATQTAPSAALAAAEHHAGAGALGVGTQRFLAAGDIGNSSARPPGNAQKKQLKDTPK